MLSRGWQAKADIATVNAKRILVYRSLFFIGMIPFCFPEYKATRMPARTPRDGAEFRRDFARAPRSLATRSLSIACALIRTSTDLFAGRKQSVTRDTFKSSTKTETMKSGGRSAGSRARHLRVQEL